MANSYSNDIMNYFLNSEDLTSVTMTFENSKEELEKLNNTSKSLLSNGIYLNILSFSANQIQVEFFKTNETDRYIEIVNKFNEVSFAQHFTYQWNKD